MEIVINEAARRQRSILRRRHSPAETAITAKVTKAGVVQNDNYDIRRAIPRAGEPGPTG